METVFIGQCVSNQDGQNGVHGKNVLSKKVLVKELVYVTVMSAPEKWAGNVKTAQMVSCLIFLDYIQPYLFKFFLHKNVYILTSVLLM